VIARKDVAKFLRICRELYDLFLEMFFILIRIRDDFGWLVPALADPDPREQNLPKYKKLTYLVLKCSMFFFEA
jgi:hypothetical protein